MNSCVDCKHCIKGAGWMSCNSPEVVTVTFDPVHGKMRKTPLCEEARKGPSRPPGHEDKEEWELDSSGTWRTVNLPACPNGKYFEEKTSILMPKPSKPRIINEDALTKIFTPMLVFVVTGIVLCVIAWVETT